MSEHLNDVSITSPTRMNKNKCNINVFLWFSKEKIIEVLETSEWMITIAMDTKKITSNER